MSLKNEMTMMRGRIAETKRELAEAELLAQADLVSIRSVLDPYESDITKINTEMAMSIADRLNNQVKQIISTRERLAKFESELGL